MDLDFIRPHFLDRGMTWYPHNMTLRAAPATFSCNPFFSVGSRQGNLALFWGLENEIGYAPSTMLPDGNEVSTAVKLFSGPYSTLHLHGYDATGVPFTQNEATFRTPFRTTLNHNTDCVCGLGLLTKGRHESLLSSLFNTPMASDRTSYVVAGLEVRASLLPEEEHFVKHIPARFRAEFTLPSPTVQQQPQPLGDVSVPFVVPPLYVGFLGTVALASLYLVAVSGAARTKRPEVRQFFVMLQWATGGYLMVACGLVGVIVGLNYLQQKNIYTKPEWVQKFLDVPVQTEGMIPAAQGGVLFGAKALGSSVALFSLWHTYDYLRKNSTPELLLVMLAGMVCVRLSRDTLLKWTHTNPESAV